MLRILSRIAPGALALAFLAPPNASAQAVWDTPAFVRPGAPPGLTLALTDAAPGDGLGVLALWRGSALPSGLGFRAGLSEAPGDDVVALFGVDVSGSLTRMVGTGAPAGIWWSGVGMGLGDDVAVSLPLGVAFSWAWVGDGVSVMPSAGAHLALDILLGDGDDLDLEGALDLGLDFALSRWVIRVGAALGGRDALAIGVRIPS
ncbi:MAG TPA: hypothetical protein VLH75_06380 [Longimicrobiales bacterium]|nr:hypothetical protein [Longimicrobiales bacterium]